MLKNVIFKPVVIFSNDYSDVSVEAVLYDGNIWLTKQHICELYGKDIKFITKHLNQIFCERDLDKESHVKRWFIKNLYVRVQFFSLDTVIIVGNRIKSVRGQQFRKWVSSILKTHILQHYDASPNMVHHIPLEDAPQLAEQIVEDFSDTWTNLVKYDNQRLRKPLVMYNAPRWLNYQYVLNCISILKIRLLKANEASKVFGNEVSMGCVEQLLNAVFVNDKLISFEEKAANLFYTLIKYHPFTDGNKRIACFLVMLYIRLNNIPVNINNIGLTTLALLISNSTESQKDNIIFLITNLLSVTKL